MDVLITEVSSGKLIMKYPIILGSLNYIPSEQEYFNEAWRCAVDDNLVTHEHREKYSLSLAR